MIFNQVKSILRNKANKIYFIVLFVLFTIFNICLSLDDMAYNYYNSKIETDLVESAKTITITDSTYLSEDSIQNIKQNEHIVNIYTKSIDLSSGKIEIYCIEIDNWKNVNSIIKEFDKNGISCMRNLSGLIYDELFNSYENVKIILKIFKYLIFIVDFLLFVTCWKNILKNEEKNINILRIIGYRNSKINTIKFIIPIICSMIMYIWTKIIVNIINYYLKQL